MNLTAQYADRIFETLRPLSKKADYWDVRLAETSGTIISYRSKVLEELSFPKSFGGSIRVLVKDGWGFVTFRDLSELAQSADEAFRYARLVGKGTNHFAHVKKTTDSVTAKTPDKDFLKVDTNEKIKTLDHYRDLLWRKKSSIVQSTLSYSDSCGAKLFVSSDGSVIEQETPRLNCIVNIVAKRVGVIQQYWDRLSFTNFATVKNQDNKIKKAISCVNQLVDAPAAKGGLFPVVMDSKLAGTFAHEAFGHLSEADNVEKDNQLKKIMQLGKKFGSDKITIYDDPSLSTWPLYRYDDEGTLAVKAPLLAKGVLVGRLHSRETAGVLGETPNGHGRAAGPSYRPIVRMGNTVIASGKSTLRDLLSGIKFGYYCCSWYAGMTDHENFTFSALYGYEINNGKLGKMIRDLKISGNLFETLHTVEGVGKDSEQEPGHCDKMGQSVPVGTTAPYLRLARAQVLGV